VMGFFNIGSCELFALGLASNLSPLDLCLLNSQDYRCEPLPPSSNNQLFISLILYIIFNLHFVNFFPNLYYFFLPTIWGFGFFLFF
jgi:hypothetical protein